METRFVEAEHGKVTVKTKKIPDPGPGQVLLKAEYSAMSPGTEYGMLAGKLLPLPQNVGYSMVARVIGIGEGVTDFKKGDLVVATGEHADYLVLDEHIVTPAPEGIDEEQAAFFILAHTAMYGIRRTSIQLGESVVVLGQGMVGLLAAQLARLSGACPLVVTDVSDERLLISKEMGVHHAINTKKDPDALAKTIRDIGPGAPSVVLEAAGVPETMEQAFSIVGEKGRVMFLSSVYPDTGKMLNFGEMLPGLYFKGATFIGGYINSKPFSLKRYDLRFPEPERGERWPPKITDNPNRFVSSNIWTSDEDIRTILTLIKYGVLNLKPLITHRFSVAEIPAAYEIVWKKDSALIGGIIKWKED
jgi:2-desacetyl-2-hydroxyethyl bacteriochlorophyllide A dehydrogenase